MSEKDRAQRHAELQAWVDAEMAEAQISDVAIDNYMDAEDRLSKSTDRRDAIGDISIEEVAPDAVQSVLEFFDHDAFAGKPEWAACYCIFHHITDDDQPGWGERTWRDNRRAISDRLSAGTTTAFVAKADGRVVGWLNASDRSTYPQMSTGEDEGIAGLSCFIVAPPYRDHGLVDRLIDHALAALASRGVPTVEAYPAKSIDNDASAFRGSKPLFERHGFEVASETEHGYVMRLEMGAGH